MRIPADNRGIIASMVEIEDGNGSLVRLEDVTKVYGSGETSVRALDHVNLEIGKGDFVVILGPSGSGKTTLLNMIGGIDRPTEGRVFVVGLDLINLNETQLAYFRRKNIGYVFQFFNLIPILTALENVMVPLSLAGASTKEAKETATDLLNTVGLGKRLDHFPSQLSGGEQQRVAIARALANNPSIVLCDEPTGNIDTETGFKIIALVRKINLEKRITFIVATHDERMVKDARVLHLVDGKIEKCEGS